ncbi:amidohydrolase family protein [Planomonospora alba]|uniref:Amidohydrolase family protein n=1 Tax=Planomonospora alba TaxID=161354 RepID=A0ABP6P4M3_9ACTN
MIDAHHHVWDLSVRDQEWITGPDLAPLRRDFGIEDLPAGANGVTATVLVQTVTAREETPELLALARGHDLIAAVVGWTDLTAPSVADDLAALRALPGGDLLRGVRHQVQGEADPRWLCRADVRAGLRAAGEQGLVYELLTLPHQLPAAIETAAALPGVSFVLDHCSKPPVASGELEPWAGLVRGLAALPNVTCKLSGLVTEAGRDTWTVEDLRPYAEVVLEAFGPDRVMFGSDWPVCLLAAPYERVVEAARALVAGLSAAERAEVFGGVAARVYGLG